MTKSETEETLLLWKKLRCRYRHIDFDPKGSPLIGAYGFKTAQQELNHFVHRYQVHKKLLKNWPDGAIDGEITWGRHLIYTFPDNSILRIQ